MVQYIERTGGERHAIDSTHPPTSFRTKMLEAFPCAAKIELDEQIARNTDDEMQTHADALGLSLVRRWEYFFD